MNRQWPLQDAKAKLSEVVKRAQSEGPQEITLRGEPMVMVVSKADYDKIVGNKPDLVSFLRQSPLAGVMLKVTRDKSPMRKVVL